MPIFFKCPGCGAIYRLHDEHSGKAATCRCGCRFRVPTPAPASTRPAALDAAEAFGGEEVGVGGGLPVDSAGSDTREYFPPDGTDGGDAVEDEDSGEEASMEFFSADEDASPAGQARRRGGDDAEDGESEDATGGDEEEIEEEAEVAVASGGSRSILCRLLLLLGAACLIEVLFLPVWTMPDGWPAAAKLATPAVETSSSGEGAGDSVSGAPADSSGAETAKTDTAKADDGWGAEWASGATPAAAAQPEKKDAGGADKAEDKPVSTGETESSEGEVVSGSSYGYSTSDEDVSGEGEAAGVRVVGGAALKGIELIQRGAEGDPLFFALAGGAGLAALLALLGLAGVRIGALVGLLLTMLVAGAEVAGFLTIIKAAEGLAAVQDALAVLPTIDPQIFMVNYGAAALVVGTLLVLLGGLGCSFGVFRRPAATGSVSTGDRVNAARSGRTQHGRVVKPGSPKRGRELTPAFISGDGEEQAGDGEQAGDDEASTGEAGGAEEDESAEAGDDSDEAGDDQPAASGVVAAGGLKKVGKKKVAKKKTAKKKKIMLKKK